VGVENLEVNIKLVGTDIAWTFDAKKINLRDFDHQDQQIQSLANEIAAALSGKKDYILLDIEAHAQVGKAQDVYPSEELVLDKSNNAKGGKSKVLYSVDQTAAMHSQKIGNAIRCIDTWYPDYDPESIGPIALEPYGAVTNLGIAYRNPKAKRRTSTINIMSWVFWCAVVYLVKAARNHELLSRHHPAARCRNHPRLYLAKGLSTGSYSTGGQ